MGYDKKSFSLISQGIAKHQVWQYVDTGGEADASVYAANGYFTDAKDRGVDTGDRVIVYDAVGKEWHNGFMTTVQDTGATSGTWVKDTG
jgi:hypothetical protein